MGGPSSTWRPSLLAGCRPVTQLGGVSPQTYLEPNNPESFELKVVRV